MTQRPGRDNDQTIPVGVGPVLRVREGADDADPEDPGGVAADVPLYLLQGVRLDLGGDPGRDVRAGQGGGARHCLQDDHQRGAHGLARRAHGVHGEKQFKIS